MALTGKRHLVVGDGYMIPVDRTRALARQGAQVLGPNGDLAEARARALAAAPTLGAAMLDLDPADDWTYPIADRLDAAAVRWLLVTGHHPRLVPAPDTRRPTLAEPCARSAVMAQPCIGRS